MRRGAPGTLAEILHPGPAAEDRCPFVPCTADPVSIRVNAGEALLETLGSFAGRSGFGSAVLDLGGIGLAPFDYVMPDRAVDDRHAAWYSDTHTSHGAVLETAVAILGWRDGTWFAHIHAYWPESGGWRLGHLLPHTLAVARSGRIGGYGIRGARFEAAPDPETEFTLYRVRSDPATASGPDRNALIATLAPFADLHDSVVGLGKELKCDTFDVMGLGSLAGAQFHNAPPMTGLISEILLQPGNVAHAGENIDLAIRAVDLDGHLHQGTILQGRAPTLITCELLLRARAGR